MMICDLFRIINQILSKLLTTCLFKNRLNSLNIRLGNFAYSEWGHNFRNGVISYNLSSSNVVWGSIQRSEICSHSLYKNNITLFYNLSFTVTVR